MERTRLSLSAALIVALASLLALPAPSGAIKAKPTKDFYGVSVNGLFTARGQVRNFGNSVHGRELERSALEVGRTDAMWGWAEPRAPKNGRHSWEWERFDDAVSTLAASGVRWLPMLGYSSMWSSSVPNDHHSPPLNDADYFAYAAAFARRYGRGGAYWREHPELARFEITTYEIWNEPNLHWFWKPEPDPARYAAMYLGARAAIKSVDPEAEVLVGGLFAPADDFVRAMYAARPDLRGNVDTMALHPYAEDVESSLKFVRRLRETLDDLGEDDVPIEITEVGWPTQGEGGLSAEALPDDARAANMSLLADALVSSNCDVQGLVPYTWATPEQDPNHDEHWLGLVHLNGEPTEAGDAYLAAAARQAGTLGDSRRALELCEGRGKKFADPLKLGLDLDRDGGDCFEASVTYRGRPLFDVAVAFEDVSRRDGRTVESERERVRTDEAGAARYCARGKTPKRAKRHVEASAAVLDVAVAKTEDLKVR